jgi:hypothetical protein
MPCQATIGVKPIYLKLLLSAELEDEESALVYLADLVRPKNQINQTNQTNQIQGETGTSQDGKRNGRMAEFTRAGSSPRSMETEPPPERTETDPSPFFDKRRVEEPKKSPAGSAVRRGDDSFIGTANRSLESPARGPAVDARMNEREGKV